MISLNITKKELKRKGEEIIDRLKDGLDQYKDFFRLKSYLKPLFEPIKRMKEDLNIAESLAMHEQLEREGKPLGAHHSWYFKYSSYLKDKTPLKKKRLVETAPSGFFRPDFESIYRILELVEIEMDIFEDLYFDVKNFLTICKIYKDSKAVS